MSKQSIPQIRGEAGVLITCDPPIKQFILFINETEKPPFVIADLDSTHLVIAGEVVDKVQARITQYVEEQNVEPDRYRASRSKKTS
jgi:Transcription factor TFIIH complex subunit Tfb5